MVSFLLERLIQEAEAQFNDDGANVYFSLTKSGVFKIVMMLLILLIINVSTLY